MRSFGTCTRPTPGTHLHPGPGEEVTRQVTRHAMAYAVRVGMQSAHEREREGLATDDSIATDLGRR